MGIAPPRRARRGDQLTRAEIHPDRPATPYIALAHEGQGVAWIGKGFVEVKGRPVVELPWFQEHGASGRTSRDEARGQLCEVHFVERSVVGDCEMCD